MSDDNLSRVFPCKNPGDALELFGQRLKLWEPPAWIMDEDNVKLRAHHDPRPHVNDNPPGAESARKAARKAYHVVRKAADSGKGP